MKPGLDYVGISTPFYCNDGQGKFVLHKRSQNCRDEQGHWDTGSGQLGFGETVEKSVLREVAEEYGCQGEIQEQLPPHSIIREHNGQRTHWLIIPHFVKVDPKEVKINEPEKADEFGWFTLDNLPKPLHTGFQYTLKKYKQYFEKYVRQS